MGRELWELRGAHDLLSAQVITHATAYHDLVTATATATITAAAANTPITAAANTATTIAANTVATPALRRRTGHPSPLASNGIKCDIKMCDSVRHQSG